MQPELPPELPFFASKTINASLIATSVLRFLIDSSIHFRSSSPALPESGSTGACLTSRLKRSTVRPFRWEKSSVLPIWANRNALSNELRNALSDTLPAISLHILLVVPILENVIRLSFTATAPNIRLQPVLPVNRVWPESISK